MSKSCEDEIRELETEESRISSLINKIHKSIRKIQNLDLSNLYENLPRFISCINDFKDLIDFNKVLWCSWFQVWGVTKQTSSLVESTLNQSPPAWEYRLIQGTFVI